MSEANTNAPPSWPAAIRSRRKALLQRLGMGAAVAIVFSPVFSWQVSAIWVAVYFLLQGLDLIIFEPINSGRVESMGALRTVAGTLSLGLNTFVFGGLTIPLWLGGGVMSGLCAAVLSAAGVVYGLLNSLNSKRVLTLTVVPHLIYLAMTPFWMSWYGASPAIVMAVSVTFAGFAVSCLSTWFRMGRAADAEAAARQDADRRRTEAERAMAGRSAFLATVSHDLRSPISAILAGAAELERGAADNNARAHAALISDAALMMKALLDDLLDHAKLDAGRMTVETIDFNLRSMIAQTLMFWQGEARARGLKLRVEGASAIPSSVRGDPMRLRQVLNNLISNAMKFTTEGSITLRLAAWFEEPSQYAVLIEVADTGPGMTAEQVNRLFTPFDQTSDDVSARHGGTGLGLSISRDLADLMGGHLTARSRLGEGAAFTLSLVMPRGAEIATAPRSFSDGGRGDIVRSLANRSPTPRSAAPAPAAAAPAVPDPPMVEKSDEEQGSGRLRVLVVDDHDINRRAVELILAPLGCDIATAADGLLALAQCEAAVFDVIFMDVRMPELDGRETTRRLRAGGGPNAGVPVIAVTADTSPDDVAACMAAGMDYFVSKPLTPAALLGALSHVLMEEGSEPEETEIAVA